MEEVKRDIPHPIECMLWGRAAGRCEFAGCNRPLWKSSVTQEPVNTAQKAHIYSFSEDGPRGHNGVSVSHLNALGNLMLICHECHRKIDREKDGGRYSVELLQRWKAQHEERVERVTGIDPKRSSHIVLYGANVGEQGTPLTYEATAVALFPDRYPAADRPIQLGKVDSAARDSDSDFWCNEAEELRRKFNQRIKPCLDDGSIRHMSVFALAPQPLLVLLGTLLTDIPEVEVYQRHREPPTWNWLEAQGDLNFEVRPPVDTSGPPALVLSLSAPITHDRVEAVLGENAAIWEITIPNPNNDFLRCRAELARFRQTVRPLTDTIKAAHGQDATLHVFPAAPVSIAVELGRIIQPKATMRWRIYDQVNTRGGFVPAIDIGPGGM